MSEVFTYNTEEALNQKPTQPQAQVLPLVAEDNPILKQVVPEFNFDNPPVNPITIPFDTIADSSFYDLYRKFNSSKASHNACSCAFLEL
jgi:hypothetical protein